MGDPLHTIKRGSRVLLIYEDRIELQRGISNRSDFFSAPPDKVIDIDDIAKTEVSDGYLHIVDEDSKEATIRLFSTKQDDYAIYLGSQKSKKAKKIIDEMLFTPQ